jgi:hypothetical protein
MEVVKILESKNRCLKKFLTYSQEFLRSAESGDFSTIQKLQDHRESVIKALQLFDRKITSTIQALRPEERTPELMRSVKAIITIEGELLQSIIETDQQIVSQIEEEKARLLKELSSSDKTAQMVKKFKSTWVSEPGEKLDGKL